MSDQSKHDATPSDQSDTRHSGHKNSDDPQGLTGLLSSLFNDTTTLVSQEIALAKAEISQKISKAANAIGSIVVAGAILQAGFVILLGAIVLALSHVLTPWLAALIVGVVVVLIGVSMLKKAKSTLSSDQMMPERTMDSLQRDQSMLKEHTHRRSEEDKEAKR